KDPHAGPAVVQRQVSGIRTDLDRFSPEESRGLIRHGYCVARHALRSRPDLFRCEIPSGPAWDGHPQAPESPAEPPAPARPPAEHTVLARTLQKSSRRRIWSTLADLRDPMTYLFVPLVLAVLLVMPYLLVRLYASWRTGSRALEVAAASGPDEAELIELVRPAPVAHLRGTTVEEVDHLDKPDLRGFEFLSDGHVVDLRRWHDEPTWWGLRPAGGQAYQYRRLQVRRSAATGADAHLRLQFPTE